MDIFDNLDIYEVDKVDYEAYFYRLPKNDIIKTTPREGFVVYKDIFSKEDVCGTLIEYIMGTEATRYFIFNFIDEERLSEHKVVKYITLNEDDYQEFLNQLALLGKHNNGDERSNA